RAWRLQGRPGAGLTRPVGQPGPARGGHRAPRRNAVGGDRRRASGGGGASGEPALRAGRAAVALRRHPRAGGAAHGLGLLPRPERLTRRQDRANPGPHRAAPQTNRAEPSLAERERFAPGVGSRILGRSTMGPAALEAYNANYVG